MLAAPETQKPVWCAFCVPRAGQGQAEFGVACLSE